MDLILLYQKNCKNQLRLLPVYCKYCLHLIEDQHLGEQVLYAQMQAVRILSACIERYAFPSAVGVQSLYAAHGCLASEDRLLQGIGGEIEDRGKKSATLHIRYAQIDLLVVGIPKRKLPRLFKQSRQL